MQICATLCKEYTYYGTQYGKEVSTAPHLGNHRSAAILCTQNGFVKRGSLIDLPRLRPISCSMWSRSYPSTWDNVVTPPCEPVSLWHSCHNRPHMGDDSPHLTSTCCRMFPPSAGAAALIPSGHVRGAPGAQRRVQAIIIKPAEATTPSASTSSRGGGIAFVVVVVVVAASCVYTCGFCARSSLLVFRSRSS